MMELPQNEKECNRFCCLDLYNSEDYKAIKRHEKFRSLQTLRFFREIFAYRSRWLVIRTKNSKRTRTPVTTTNVSLTAQRAHKENKTTIVIIVLAVSLLHSTATHASPSQNRVSSLLSNTSAKGQADGYP